MIFYKEIEGVKLLFLTEVLEEVGNMISDLIAGL